MNGKDLIKIGFTPGPVLGIALAALPKAALSLSSDEIRMQLKAVLEDPAAHLNHSCFAQVAQALVNDAARSAEVPIFTEREKPAPFQIWGSGLEPGAVEQIRQAARLPVAVAGALMPDAHIGYGLPIGGVLATENSVIPYAVGVDIACRMRLSVYAIPATLLERLDDQLVRTLTRETLFGTGGSFQKPHEHEVLEADWSVSAITKRSFSRARAQLGTSGSGNHFVEFGVLTIDHADLGLEPGKYLALLSHSGSRGTGAAVADFYCKLAMEAHPELPPELRRLAWLDMDTDAGREYWAAMNLMGQYAAANHEIIHQKIARSLKAEPMASVENHHNFAWLENHGGRDVYVHRKGATPAGQGVLGVIPGSMATPGFVVRGRGNAKSLRSASHGAGRVMSRTKARETFRWNHVKPVLEAAGVRLISAGLDEAPGVYKDIHTVMKAQDDLVSVVARFDPKIVKMADAGEKPED